MAEKGSKGSVSTERKAIEPTPPAFPLMSLHREIDRLFDEFSRGFSLFPLGRDIWDWGSRNGGLTPSVDVAETEDGFEVTAELPGLTEDNIDVSLADGVLTLKGEKKEEQEKKEKDYYLSERRYGAFRRSFRLPEGVDEDKIEAKFDKGVLRIILPKTQEAVRHARKIAIKAS